MYVCPLCCPKMYFYCKLTSLLLKLLFFAMYYMMLSLGDTEFAWNDKSAYNLHSMYQYESTLEYQYIKNRYKVFSIFLFIEFSF